MQKTSELQVIKTKIKNLESQTNRKIAEIQVKCDSLRPETIQKNAQGSDLAKESQTYWFVSGIIATIVLYFVYMVLLVLLLPRQLILGNELLTKFLGFILIVSVPMLLVIGAYIFLKMKNLIHKIVQYEDVFKAGADLLVICAIIGKLYQNYQLPLYDNVILSIAFTNDYGLLGFPYVYLIIRFAVVFCALIEKRKSKEEII